LEDRNIPLHVPTRRFVFESAKHVIGCFGKPESALLQIAPLLVETKAQLSLEATKRFEPDNARVDTLKPGGNPVLILDHPGGPLNATDSFLLQLMQNASNMRNGTVAFISLT